METGDYTIWINDEYDYSLTDKENNERNNFTVKGEGIIRGLETMQGIKPKEILLSGENIVSLSDRGISISIPELNIERLFVPDEYVKVDEISKNLTVFIEENWNYYA